MSTPDFSCVITAGEGGEEALAASLESVLEQSMRAVEAVVVLPSGAPAALRAAAGTQAGRFPDRVRVLDPGTDRAASLRNTGLDAARGTYVLVLDAGERLQRHACRNLWEAGTRTRADLVAGRWSRLTGDGTKEREPSWQQPLFARSRTVARFTEAPELAVRDALLTGFCVRRAALERHALRYDEDLTHSAVLFGPLVAAAVGRIALVRRRIVSGRAAPDMRPGSRRARRGAPACVPCAGGPGTGGTARGAGPGLPAGPPRAARADLPRTARRRPRTHCGDGGPGAARRRPRTGPADPAARRARRHPAAGAGRRGRGAHGGVRAAAQGCRGSAPLAEGRRPGVLARRPRPRAGRHRTRPPVPAVRRAAADEPGHPLRGARQPGPARGPASSCPPTPGPTRTAPSPPVSSSAYATAPAPSAPRSTRCGPTRPGSAGPPAST